MTTSDQIPPAVSLLCADVRGSKAGAKRLKLRTLLGKFGYSKRSDSNTAAITQMLSEAGIALNPPIVRFGESWEITSEDWIYLSSREAEARPTEKLSSPVPKNWNEDGWFDRIASLELRTEKEVEIKFIVPLLARLGYADDDRYDGMPVPASLGSRGTTLVVDFALFNASLDSLRNQPLLTVEAKCEGRLSRLKDLTSAHNQAKSYCMWTQCDFFMITDSRTVQAYQIARGRHGELSPIFDCKRHELSARFADLYALLSKDVLTRLYLAKFSSPEEAR